MTAQVITTATDLAPAYDVVIVGAGPAGLTAAVEAAANGVSTLVLDEGGEPGGQMYRAITRLSPEVFGFLGPDYWRGAALNAAFQASRISYAPRTSVWSLAPGGDALSGPRAPGWRSGYPLPAKPASCVPATSSWPPEPSNGPCRCPAGPCPV